MSEVNSIITYYSYSSFQLAVCKYRLVFFFGSEIIRSHLGPIRKAVYFSKTLKESEFKSFRCFSPFNTDFDKLLPSLRPVND